MAERPSSPLLLGGTFDPVHHGHLIVARAAAEAIGADRVLLIPCAQSPHKTELTTTTPAHHRLEMLRQAVAGDGFFDILSLELERPPPSYSYDTAQQLFAKGYPKLCWLIGADQLLALPRWHRASELIQQVKFVVAARPGFTVESTALPPEFRPICDHLIELPQVDISASEVRRRVAAGKSVRYLVPDSVADYIEQYRLYRA